MRDEQADLRQYGCPSYRMNTSSKQTKSTEQPIGLPWKQRIRYAKEELKRRGIEGIDDGKLEEN